MYWQAAWHRPSVAPTGRLASLALQTKPADIVVVDVVLGDGVGDELDKNVGAPVGLGVGRKVATVGFGVAGVGGGVGPEDATWKSKQEMKISGGCPQMLFPLGATALYSSMLKGSVFRPTLFESMHELPVFQSHRPTARLVGQEKSSGTLKEAVRVPPVDPTAQA